VTKRILGDPIAKGRTAEIYTWENGQILKLFLDWVDPRWVEEEATAARVVHAAGLPVPRCGEVVEVDNRFGIVFEQVYGITMLQSLQQHPHTMFAIISELARLHTRLHSTSVPELPSQYAAVKWTLQHAPVIQDDQRELLLAQLDRLPEGDRVCHNDFHPDNVIITQQGPLIIDWMTARRGNPMADVARTALLINNGSPIRKMPGGRFLAVARRLGYWWYRQQYTRLGQFDSNQFKQWLPIMAAARLNERISGEEEWLLRLIEQGLRNVEHPSAKKVQSR
jgi:uncharacterized protein (TIGR02172 family)